MDVMTRVHEHYEVAKSIFPEDLIIGVFLYGSQNYNMGDEQSDVDTKVLVVPSLADVVCARRPVAFEHHCDVDNMSFHLPFMTWLLPAFYCSIIVEALLSDDFCKVMYPILTIFFIEEID